ncbi:unnamed protein product, partial [marine sediment metagenome]
EWISHDHATFTDWDKFAYRDSDDVWYCDFDLDISTGGSDADVKADFAFKYNANTWFVTIGNNGSFRDKDGTTQLWDFEEDSAVIADCYPEQDNDYDNSGTPHNPGIGDCPDDPDDCIEVFIIVRSTGITVAPGSDYPGDPSSLDYLSLVNDANPHLPNPMRQVIESGFYLDGSGLTIKQFYFGKVHNLKADNEL